MSPDEETDEIPAEAEAAEEETGPAFGPVADLFKTALPAFCAKPQEHDTASSA